MERLRVALERRRDVAFGYLFGSVARGRVHRLSDVDVGVFVYPEGRRAASGGAGDGDVWLDVLATVQEAFPGREVDVVLLNQVPPLLGDRIVRSGLLVFSRDEACRIRWMVETKSRYCDLKPVRAMLDRTLSERVHSGRFGRRGG